jgi:predicted GIY-YIG superfamily endonuclease
MYFVYIIHSKLTSKSYTGITSDLDRRIEEHNKLHSVTRWTDRVTDFECVFCTQVEDRATARLLEMYLKSGIGRQFKNLMLVSVKGL